MPTLRILSYNIHKGLTVANRRFVLERMRTAIRSVDAEVVFLQEVQGEHRHHATKFADWPMDGQCEYLADSIWSHHAYGKNALYDHGHHGNAILSKHPFSAWENLDVSNNRWERRGLLHGVIRHPALQHDLHLICCHLDLFERGRKKQVQKLIDRIASAVPAECPLLVAGDFNDWRARVDPHRPWAGGGPPHPARQAREIIPGVVSDAAARPALRARIETPARRMPHRRSLADPVGSCGVVG
jgi:endonuclease/exonuclease/phosphatase family metal-dependent hydrolase